jgi:3-hydroxypropanoate dehydrogenase
MTSSPFRIEQLFEDARTHNGFVPTPVPEATLRALYERAKWPPTATNSNPMRVCFVTSAESKARLLPCMDAGNVEKTRGAPVTAILGMDLEFHDKLPFLFPHAADARGWFAGKPEKIRENALRNASLQGGYFILAARSLGLDCGPMGGFDAARVDAEFWAGTAVKTNFICNLGHGDPARLRPRGPRFAFNEVCRIC